MAFNSLEFVGFLLVVLAVARLLQGRRLARNLALLLASYAFYACWDWRFLSLIWLSTGVDWLCGQRIHRAESPRAKRRWLLLSLTTNLGLLGVFKYFGFFADSLLALLAGLGVEPGWILPTIVLPVGISFYTFQTLSYTIDIHRGTLEPCESPVDFALFVAFFPQLVAGPIERAAVLLPQLAAPRPWSAAACGSGAWLLLTGLFKKVAVADGVAPYVDLIYGATASQPSAAELWLATALFAAQIYADFSGYTDIARGVARLLGIELMVNFDVPYASRDPSEFWRRWHISLSSWLRDYLYIPLGGNRGTPLLTYRNLFLTMLLGGLWHGARWNFVLWGAYHGALLCLYRAAGWSREPSTGVRGLAQGVVFFALTLYGWLLFRCETLSQVAAFSAGLFTATGGWHAPLEVIGDSARWGLPALLVLDAGARWPALQPRSPRLRFVGHALLAGLLAFCILLGVDNEPVQFVYFQF